MITVAGNFSTPEDEAPEGRVIFTLDQQLFNEEDGITVVSPVITELDNGNVAVLLRATTDDDTTPVGATYQCEVQLKTGRGQRFHFELPANAPGGILDLGGANRVTSYGEFEPNAVPLSIQQAIDQHVAAANPHPQYALDSDVAAAIASMESLIDDVLANVGDLLPNVVSASSYMLALTDRKTFAQSGRIHMTNAGPNQIVVPLDSTVDWPIDGFTEVWQYGAGVTSFVGETGEVIIRKPSATASIATRYGTGGLVKVDTNEWLLSGELA